MSDPALRILLLDESEERARALQDALRRSGHTQMTWVRRTVDVLQTVKDINPDVILIDVESPTRDTIEQLTLIRDKQPRPVVLLTQDQTAQSIRAAISSGVSAYLTAGISPEQVRPAIEVARETFKAFQSLRGELAQARTHLEHQKLVDRAKSVLMSQHKLTEDRAYHLLRRLAMNRKRKLVDVAQDVLAMADLTGTIPPPL